MSRRHYKKSEDEDSCTADFPGQKAVDWDAVGASAPTPEPLSDWDPDDDLPEVDVVILTWTTAEWASMYQVFCNQDPDYVMPYDGGDDEPWSQIGDDAWMLYSQNWSTVTGEDFCKGDDPPPSCWHEAWGRFRIVKINPSGKRVMLFKSDMHISTDGPTLPLQNFIQQILAQAKPSLIMSIGTAGGARTRDCIGTANIANSAHLALSCKFADISYNNQTFYNNWKPAVGFLTTAARQFNDLSDVLTWENLRCLADATYFNNPDGYPLDVLVTPQIKPGAVSPRYNNLCRTDAGDAWRSPIFTTDTYLVATTAGGYNGWTCMEMDDAIIAYEASRANTAFGFVRNISDPVINYRVSDVPNDEGKTDQSSWGGSVYGAYGFYTAFNGALMAWASVAGRDVSRPGPTGLKQ